MVIYAHGVVDTEHPSIVDAIRNMIRQGYSKESIFKVTEAPMEVIEKHQRLAEQQMGKPKSKITESERQEMLDKMQRMRDKRKIGRPKKTLAEKLKPEE